MAICTFLSFLLSTFLLQLRILSAFPFGSIFSTAIILIVFLSTLHSWSYSFWRYSTHFHLCQYFRQVSDNIEWDGRITSYICETRCFFFLQMLTHRKIMIAYFFPHQKNCYLIIFFSYLVLVQLGIFIYRILLYIPNKFHPILASSSPKCQC